MDVLLMRHAKSAYPMGVPDHDRPLNGRGSRNALAAGRWLGDMGIQTVLVSSAERAQQTWQIVSSFVECPAEDVPELYEASAQTIDKVIHSRARGRTLIVAHNPGLEDYVLSRATPGPDAESWNQLRYKYPTSAIAHVRDGVLVDFVIPR